jgi:hypothetical protein
MPVVLGTASTVAPFGNSASELAFTMDIRSMVGITALCLPVFFDGPRLNRGEAIPLSVGYVGGTVYPFQHGRFV